MQSEKLLKFKSSPTTEAAKQAAAALKAELEMELQNLKQCAYKPYECTQLSLEGNNYCLRHILQDKNAPYKPCAYVYSSNGKRCHLPAPKDKKECTGYCNEHALKTHLATSKRNNRCQPPRTAETLLHSVSHYIRKPRTRTASSSTQHSEEGRSSPDDNNDGLTTKSLDPFVDVDANTVLTAGSEILDMCSESESDVDATSYGSVWQDAHADSSDNESIDSEQEDVLKHANIYSAEEVTLITRDKLIRLQSLYIDEFRYLTHMLRERRRRYLYALKREKETFCSIYNQIHDSPKEQRMYKKLKAYNSYHKKHGIEAVCHKRLHERRLKATEGVNLKPPSFSKCVFTEGGVKCGERALPVTRHCRKHILEDPNQILFRACGKMGGDIECTTPVEAIFDDATCRLHMDIPLIRSYSQTRKDSESDYEESLEAQGLATSSMHVPHIKVESIEPATKSHHESTDISQSQIQKRMNEIENFNTSHSSNIVPNIADVDMPLASNDENSSAITNKLLSAVDTSIGFATGSNRIKSLPDQVNETAMHTDPVISTAVNMDVTQESAAVNDFRASSELSAFEDTKMSVVEESEIPTDTVLKPSMGLELPGQPIISSTNVSENANK